MTSPYVIKPRRTIEQAEQDAQRLRDQLLQDLPDNITEPPRLNIFKSIMLKFRGRPMA